MKEGEVQRSVLRFTVVIETSNGESDARALRTWTEDRVLNATRGPRPGQFIAIAAVDKEGKVLRSTTHGTPQGESSDIVEELFDVEG